MHLGGVKDALNDYMVGVLEAMSDSTQDPQDDWLRDAPSNYTNLTGRDLFEDAGNPLGRIRAILKLGKIESEEEFRLLNDVLINIDQEILTPKQVLKAEKLLAEFEGSAAE